MKEKREGAWNDIFSVFSVLEDERDCVTDNYLLLAEFGHPALVLQ
jgi:hypothetical protein